MSTKDTATLLWHGLKMSAAFVRVKPQPLMARVAPRARSVCADHGLRGPEPRGFAQNRKHTKTTVYSQRNMAPL